MAVAILLFVILIIAFGLYCCERILAKRPDRFSGLIMPIAFFILSIVSVVKSAPSVFADMQELGGGISGVILSLVISFVLINVPTLFVYIVYYRTRRKMGERPWPLRSQPNNSTNKKRK